MPDLPDPANVGQRSSRSGGFRRYRLAAAISLVWAGVVYAAYYVVHKPLTLAHAEAFTAVLVTLIAWVATLTLAHALSRLIPFEYVRFTASVRLALRIGLGLGLLSVALIILGWLPIYRSWLAWAILIIAVPLGGRGFARDLRATRIGPPSSRSEWALAIFVMLMMLLAFFIALAPPTAWDSLVYHLTGPKLYLEAQGLIHDIDLPYLGFPHGGSMLFLWGLMLAGPELSQLLHWSFALLSLPLLYASANQLMPKRGWLACALLVGVPSASLLAGWAYVEWIVMFAGLAAFMLLFPTEPVSDRKVSGPDTKALIFGGIFLGVALSGKYTSIGLVAGLLLALAVQRRKLRPLVVTIAAATVFTVPFLLKNLVLTGNPVYPFFFEGTFWDSLRALWYSRSGTGLSLVELLLAPWEATIWGIEGAIVEGQRPYGATIGPALLTLLPFGILGLRRLDAARRSQLRFIAIVTGTAYIGWAVLLAFSELLVQTRLLFPVLPFVVLLATYGFHSLANIGRPGKSAQFVIGGLLALGFVLTAISRSLTVAASSPHAVLIGNQSESSYLVQELGVYQLAMGEINKLPPQSKVLFLWEPRSYYCSTKVVCLPDALLDRWWHARRIHGDEASIAEAWVNEGVTHVLLFRLGAEEIQEAGFDPLTQDDWDALDRFFTRFTESDSKPTDLYALYRLSGVADPEDG